MRQISRIRIFLTFVLATLVCTLVRAGSWHITVDYTGVDTFTMLRDNDAEPIFLKNFIQADNVRQTTEFDIWEGTSKVTPIGFGTLGYVESNTGGINVTLSSGVNSESMSPEIWRGTGSSKSVVNNGRIRVTFQWVPINNDFVNDPPPPGIYLIDWVSVEVSAEGVIGETAGSSAGGTATVNCAGVQSSASATHSSPNGVTSDMPAAKYDEYHDEYHEVDQYGEVVVEYPVTWTLEAKQNNSSATNLGLGLAPNVFSSAGCVINLSVGLSGLELWRGDWSGVPGNYFDQGSDPSFTRWLPLDFSPRVSSQPFRFAAGALQAPWGNVNCPYSVALRKDKNVDLFGAGSVGFGFPSTNTLLTRPAYSIIDASGDRLAFFSNLSGHGNVHSNLSAITGGYKLQNAGPPWAMAERGDYTYVFSAFDSSGTAKLLSIEDPNGNIQTCAYSTGNNFLTVTDSSSGRSLRFYKGTNGYINEAVAPRLDNGLTFVRTELIMDGTGHMTSAKVFDAAATSPTATTTYTYSGDAIASSARNGWQSTQTFVNGSVNDPFGNPIKRLASLALGSTGDTSSSDDGGSVKGTWQYTYGWPNGSQTSWLSGQQKMTETDPRGNQFETSFLFTNGLQGAINSFTFKGPAYSGAASGTNIWKQAFTPNIVNPTLVVSTDPFNKNWQTTYDSFGNTLTQTDPLANQWVATYTTNGKDLLTVKDPTNLTWTLNYGENSQPTFLLTSLLDPIGTKLFELTYNGFGQVTQSKVPAVTSASGIDEITSYAYASVTGDLLSITNALGEKVTIDAYDHLGDPLSYTIYPDTGDPSTSIKPLATTVTYDAAQMPTLIASPDGTSFLAAYTNGAVNRFQVKQGANVLAQIDLSRDTRGRVYGMSDTVGSLGGYRFDRTGNVTRIIDGRGNATQLSYGANGEATGTTWPGGASISMSYDKAGRLTSFVNERSQSVSYGYDDAGRVTSVGGNTFTYDAADRLLTASDSSGGETFTYASSTKWLQSIAKVIGAQTYQVSYTYYPDGQIATMVSPVGTTSYAYDKLGRVSTVTDPFGNVTTWTYDKAGRVTGQSTAPSGVGAVPIVTGYTWGISGIPGDTATGPNYLRKVTQVVNGLTLWDYTLKHSYLGQITQQSGTGPSGDSETIDYGYDGRGRLTASSQTHTIGGTTYSHSSAPTYDLANNVNGGTGGWTYDTRNRVTAAAPLNGLPGVSGISYDASGNMTAAAGMTLNYDAFSQLTSVTGTPSGTVSFTYDYEGNRVSKTVGGATTHFLYDGDLLIAEIDAATGAVKRSYTWGPLGVISDRDHVAGTSRFYLYDKGGHVRTLVGNTGTVLSKGAYTPYGSPVNALLLPSTPLAWNGRAGCYRDDETGLILAGARYYAPAIGRFIQPDPSGFEGGINSLFGYCGGDPVNLFDADGLEGQSFAEWYMGGMGGFSNWLDNTPFFGGSTQRFGDAAGRYEVGKASGWEVAGAGLEWAANTVETATLIYGAGRAAYKGGKALIGAGRKMPGCFVAGTLVAAIGAGGEVVYKPIEGIKEGEYVLARNPRNNQNSVQVVERTMVREVGEIITLHFVDTFGLPLEPITTTPDHPFYVSGVGFVEAGQLGIGTEVVTRAGPTARVVGTETQTKPTTVYNFAVANDHTYFVGHEYGGIWVHNNRVCLNAAAKEAADRGVDSIEKSSRAARRGMKRKFNIPQSKQPTRTWRSPHGNAYEYEHEGKKFIISQEKEHAKHGPHWEGGPVKPGGQTGPGGIPRYGGGRTKPRIGYGKK